MSDFGITDAGFNRKRTTQILDELNAAHKTIFGDNFNVSPDSPDGQVNAIIAESLGNLWEIAELAYNAFNPSAANGNVLSNLVQLNRIVRKAAASTVVQSVDITGTNGTVIPAGSIVSTTDGIEGTTDTEVTINGAGAAIVNVTITETGPIEIAIGTLTNIDTPITGWATVNNPFAGIQGTDEETDVELRSRRSKSTALEAASIIDSIRGEILEQELVEKAVVLENTTLVTDGEGLPGKSFRAVVLGGTDADIAQAIFSRAPTGIRPDGTEIIEVLDSAGLPHTIRFSRPTEITIYVVVNITGLGTFPSNGDELVAQAIVDYANGELVDGREFSLGDDIIHSELYTPINTIPGGTVDSLYINTTGAPGPGDDSDIAISTQEISMFELVNITVNVT